MRWPGKIPAGTTCDHIAGNIDVLPTLAKIAGGSLPADRPIDGRDISSLMFEPKPAAVRDTHLYFGGESLQAIRVGDWKLFPRAPQAKKAKKKQKDGTPKTKAAGPELYDLAADPGETKNVAADHPDIVSKLRQEAERREAEIKANKRPPGRLSAAKE
jgi:arylsulfatase A-like enzyme